MVKKSKSKKLKLDSRRWKSIDSDDGQLHFKLKKPTLEDDIQDTCSGSRELSEKWAKNGIFWLADLVWIAQVDAIKKTIKYLKKKDLMKVEKKGKKNVKSNS